MNSLWWTCMIILLVVLFITGVVLLKAFLRDIKYVNRLASPIYPEIAIVPQINTDDEYNNLPITNGILVNETDEDLHIINV